MEITNTSEIGFEFEETTEYPYSINISSENVFQTEASLRSHCSFFGDPLFMFMVGGLGIGLTSLIGVVGNIFCMIILSRPVMRSSINILLFCLSICDFIFVLTALFIFGIPYSIEYFCVEHFDHLYRILIGPIIITYLVPLISVAQLGSTYFTLSVTIERFIVVYRPLLARPYCTVKNSIWVSVIISTLSILYTLPTWWEFSLESIYDQNHIWIQYMLIPGLRKNLDYVLYYRTWVSMFVYRVIPMISLTILNVSIYVKVRQASKSRETMTASKSNEISLAKMLICIVTIFLICNLSQVFVNMREALKSPNSPELITTSLLLFNINSAVNFIVYCCMAKKFRNTFVQTFSQKSSNQPNSKI